MMRTPRLKYFTGISAVIICCVALAAYYATSYPCHLLWQEQNQIFLNDPSWTDTYFSKPAWLGCLLGEWLTQFYHNIIAGAITLTLAIATSTALFASAVSRVVSKIPAFILTLLFAILLIFCSFSSSSHLAFFMCVAGGLVLGFAGLTFRFNRILIYLSPLLIILSYWTFGFGSLLTALFMILFSLKTSRKRSLHPIPSRVAMAFSLILAFGTPAALYEIYQLPYHKALLYPGIVKPTVPQKRFEKRLQIAEAFYHRDYENVKRLSIDNENPDEISAFYFYLASAVQDSLPDNLLKYPVKSPGTLTTIGEKTQLPVINMMNDLYFELGDMTYAERAAMMRNVFSPKNRNIRMICRLAEINLISGDTLASLKYLKIIDKTRFYSDWSRDHTPGRISGVVLSEILRRRSFSNNKDNIRLGDNCRNILLELLESNPGNTIALDYLLCTDLLLKDMDTFKMDYDTYCMTKGSPRYKDLYQQALMIYLAGTDAPQEEWEKYIVSSSQLQRFNQYSNRRGDPHFSDTYWYYFDRQ